MNPFLFKDIPFPELPELLFKIQKFSQFYRHKLFLPYLKTTRTLRTEIQLGQNPK